MTYYLFFDTWNPPFDNVKLRQAISHAIDRDKIVNGPLQYQSQAAYTMNPPGFPARVWTNSRMCRTTTRRWPSSC